MSDTSPDTSRNWRFRVTKLGALTHGGNFEVKPLTLFCGDNNTCKTWVMYAAYGFLRKRNLPTSGLLQGFFSENIAHQRINFKEWLEKNWEKAITRSSNAMAELLPEILNADKDLLNEAKIEWQPDKNALISNSIGSGWGGMARTDNNTVLINKIPGEENIQVMSSSDKVDVDFLQNAFPLHSSIIGCGNIFLMPAERCGLQLFHKELSLRRAAQFHNASREEKNQDKGLRDVVKSSYAEPIADYIDWLNNLSDKKESTPYSDIAKELATKIAGGKYRVDKYGNVFFTPRNIQGAYASEMEIHNASSTVKSVFGLWYYLQYDAEGGDVVMIDEPELNLHPARQRLLARILVKMAKRNFYVVASTHSDYIVREVNILLMLDKHPNRVALMEKHKIDGETLAPEYMGTYEMSAQSGKIEPMKMDDEGMDASTLDEVIKAQGAESDDIYYSSGSGQ